jgi:uncharacterized protein (TIGR00369 family)
VSEKIPNDVLTRFAEEGIPFNQYLGFRVGDLGDGTCDLYTDPRPEFTGDPFRPALHGGLLSALADASGGLAVFTRATRDQRISTVDMRVDYLRVGKVDARVTARSRVIRLGNKVAVTETMILQGDDDQPIALCRAVYNLVTRPPRSSKP